MLRLDVLSVVSEIFPLIKTGGLADVAGALPGALASHGIRVRTLVPGYRPVMQALDKATVARVIPDLFGGRGRLLRADAAGLELYVLDAPHLYDRPGGPYAGPDGLDFPDNAFRFAALGRVGAAIAQGLVPRYQPQIVHTHDWQAGLTAAYLNWSGQPKPPLVATIHNLAFQGQVSPLLLAPLGLPPAAFTIDGVEYYGDIGFLKAALLLADRITTVSPTYAAEICTDQGGMGLGGLLRGRSDRLLGILNGVDTAIWNPQTDSRLAATYCAQDLSGRAANKAALQARLGLAIDPHAPLFGVVSRLDWQKGLDLLLEALPALAAEGAQLALLGSGDPLLEAGFRQAIPDLPGQVGCAFVYDEALAHLIQGGADALVVPSRFEPCGLTQLCALRYGAVPVVARVGGLSDTVIDASPMGLASGAATGVQFAPVQTPLLERALRQAVALYRQPDVWRRLQANGMATDVSWTEPARRYAALYADLVPAA